MRARALSLERWLPDKALALSGRYQRLSLSPQPAPLITFYRRLEPPHMASLRVNIRQVMHRQLIKAARSGNRYLVRLYLFMGATDPAALCVAADQGHAEVVRLMLDHGVTDPAALCIAADQGHAEVVRVLLDHDKGDPTTVLGTAIYNGHADVVRVLLNHGARIDLESLHTAVTRGYPSVVEALLWYGAATYTTTFLTAVCCGYLEVVKLLLQYGASNPSALRLAVEYGHLDIVRLLLNHGVRPTIRTVIIASSLGHLDIVRAMIYYATQESRVSLRSAAVTAAAQTGQVEIARSLLYHVRSDNTYTLVIAARHSQVDLVQMLLAKRVPYPTSLISDAVYREDIAIVRVLVADKIRYYNLRKVQLRWRRSRLRRAAKRIAPLKWELAAVFHSPTRLSQLQRSGYLSDTYTFTYDPNWIRHAVALIRYEMSNPPRVWT